jgi:SWI/SNF-related matrix-associated actin-dependent regulator 1 of chromatin subfamily A
MNQIPTYLQPLTESTYYYGTLSYRKQDNSWLIKAEPMVMQMVKRLFIASDQGSGVAKFKLNKRITGDLNWLMMRYPLNIVDKDIWDKEYDKAINHVHHTQNMLITPKKETPSFLFKGELFEFQKEALGWMLHFKKTLLADDTGLGKTVSFISLISKLQKYPVLIVCPKHIIVQWKEMINTFMSSPEGNEMSMHEITGTKPYELPEANIYFVHYGLLGYWKDTFDTLDFPVIGFDEVHYLRHKGTQKYSSASIVASNAEYVIGMSATPIFNYGSEMWNIANIIEYQCLGDWESFSREWCTGYGEKIVAKPELLGEYMRTEGLLLRRTKDMPEIKDQIPQKFRATYPVDMEEEIFNKLIKSTIQKAKDYDSITKWNEKGLAKTQIIEETRRATGIAKALSVSLFTRSLLESGERVILFGYHHDVYDIWENELSDFKPAVIHGKAKNRTEDLKRFLNNETNLLIMSIRSGEGLNLQGSCRCVVFGELDWSPSIHKQAEDRVHRLGQTEQVMIYYLTATGGADEHIQETLGLKKSQFISLMGDKLETEEDKELSHSKANDHMDKLIDQLKKAG